MADTRCANPAYQLDVDEMTLEYLVYTTLRAHLNEWDPDHRINPRNADHRRSNAATLLSILDTDIHLFNWNHPYQKFSTSTDFYLRLLEFFLLFTHYRGGPSMLSESSYRNAQIEGQTKLERRVQCWRTCEALQVPLTAEDEDLLVTCSQPRVSDENGYKGHVADRGRNALPVVVLMDLLPRLMELSAQITKLTETQVSEMWLRLAADFMLQAAIEAGISPPYGSRPPRVHYDILLPCFGWGLPLDAVELVRSMDGIDAEVAASESAVHEMLLSSTGQAASRTASWDYHRTRAMSELIDNIPINIDDAQSAWEVSDRWEQFTKMREKHPMREFEIQVVEYVKNLQTVWAQINEEPILLQIEQGRLEGLNDKEFRAFINRVGSDEQEERLQSIMVPGSSKI